MVAGLVLIVLYSLDTVFAQGGCVSIEGFASCSDLTGVTSLPAETKTLVLSEATVETLPGFTFRHLPKLTELSIKSSYFDVVKSNAFTDLPNLERLSLSHVDITVIESEAFSGLRGLSYLDISESTLDNIDPRAFSALSAIGELVIRNNNISFIDGHAFYNISNIKIFQFNENRVTQARAGAFSEWSSIQQSNVNSNTFSKLGCFSNTSFTVALNFTFHRNYLECACHLAWMLTSPVLKEHMLSNMCGVPGSETDLGMAGVSMSDLMCPANASLEEMGCPKYDTASQPDVTAQTSHLSTPRSTATPTKPTTATTRTDDVSSTTDNQKKTTFQSLQSTSVPPDVTTSGELPVSTLSSGQAPLCVTVVLFLMPIFSSLTTLI